MSRNRTSPHPRPGPPARRPATARKPTHLRRRDIADAALAIIAEEGLAGFTAAGIARRVGVSDAALFRHFTTKQDIVLAVIDRVEELLFPEQPAVSGPPLERLGRFFRHRVDTLGTYPGVARLLLSELLEQVAPPEGVRRIAECKRRTVQGIRECLTEAHAAGALASTLTVDTATVVIVGTVMALAQGVQPAGGSRTGGAAAIWASIEPCLRRGDGPGHRSADSPGPASAESPRAANVASTGKDPAP
jgi:AcrR family transcriptional regulator